MLEIIMIVNDKQTKKGFLGITQNQIYPVDSTIRRRGQNKAQQVTFTTKMMGSDMVIQPGQQGPPTMVCINDSNRSLNMVPPQY